MSRTFICPKSGCPFQQVFSCLNPAQVASLGCARMGRRYDPGEVVFHSDTLSLAVYCIHAGRVRLSRPTRGGESIVVGVRGAGEVLGFREVIAETPYQASVEAIAPSMICEVPRETFLTIVQANHELALRLMKRLAREYIGAETQLVVRAYKDVSSRVAQLLSANVSEARTGDRQKQRAEVSMSREEMAVLVGTTRETLSRTLKKLQLLGIIHLENGTIHVLNLQALHDLAD